MESLKIYRLDNMYKEKLRKGFTLFETLIVIGIFTIIVSFGLTVDLNFLKSDILHKERSVIVSALEKARSRSMNNIFQSPHGFCYISPNYVIFRDGVGTRCVAGAVTNELIGANVNIAENLGSTFPAVIIFSQLSGTTTDSAIHITDGIKSADITTNYEGRINW